MIGGFAKDVTRRYAKVFNSKTWKYRVESQGGERWWTRVINYLDRMEPLVRIPTESQLNGYLGSRPIGGSGPFKSCSQRTRP